MDVQHFFRNYTYKKFQHRIQQIDPEQMAAFYSEKFRAEENTFFFPDQGQARGIASLVYMPCFSRAIDREVYFLKTFIAGEDEEKVYRELACRVTKAVPRGFIISKVPVDNQNSINALSGTGFYYVCTESVFSLNAGKLAEIDQSGFEQVFPCSEAMLPGLTRISAANHRDVRYYYDANFPHDKIKNYFSSIVRQSFRHPHHRVFVYRCDNEIAGFITVIINKQLGELMHSGYGSLDYIVVDKKFQRQNIGYTLNNYALAFLQKEGIINISVKTMGSNYQAMRLLTKNRFIITSQNLVLHHYTA